MPAGTRRWVATIAPSQGFPAMARTVVKMSSLRSSLKSPGYQRSRTTPFESTRKNAR
jgi:hypothetical protein